MLTAGVTAAKLAHLTELRVRINAVRTAFGLPAASWTVPAPSAGVTGIKAADILEMRSALAEVYAVVGLSMPAFTDPTLTGVTVKTAHINELRQRVVAIE